MEKNCIVQGNKQIIADINRLKQEKNAVILAHYYETGAVQDAADIVGDSFALSRMAKDTDASIIVFCGVRFMAESAKILSPHKKVLLPVPHAGCPMADMVTPEDVRSLREKHPQAAVVCYVNSSCEVKAESDVCVTSSNAVKIVRAMDEKQIIFVPDQNLGRYVAENVQEKEVFLHSGFCPVHHRLTSDDVAKAKAQMPGAVLLAHPECTRAVLDAADYIGSTAQILDYAKQAAEQTFIIATEEGILHKLHKDNPDKVFFPLTPNLLCTDMKKTTLLDLRDALLYEQHEISLSYDVMSKARRCLDRMLILS